MNKNADLPKAELRIPSASLQEPLKKWPSNFTDLAGEWLVMVVTTPDIDQLAMMTVQPLMMADDDG